MSTIADLKIKFGMDAVKPMSALCQLRKVTGSYDASGSRPRPDLFCCPARRPTGFEFREVPQIDSRTAKPSPFNQLTLRHIAVILGLRLNAVSPLKAHPLLSYDKNQTMGGGHNFNSSEYSVD